MAYINLVNAKEIDIKNIANILMNTMDNMVFCVKQSNIPKLRDEIDKKKCKVYDCEHDWRTVQKKIDPETGNCIQSCADTTNYKYEYLSQCYEKCPEGTSANENNICETKQIIPTTIITQKIIETTNIEKIIETTIPKIIQTTIPEKLVTTIPKIIQTTIPKIIKTTIPEKMQTTIPKIIETTIPQKIDESTNKLIETEKIKESVIKLKEETNNENDDINNTEERINFSTDIKRNQIYTDNLKETQEEITSTLSFISSHETNKESYNILISTNLITQSAKKECNYENYINHLCNVIDVDIVTTGENFIKDILISYPIIKGKSVTATDGNVTFQITTGENEIKCLEGNCDDNRGLSVIDFRACETLLRNKYHISENVSLIYFKMESISNNAYERNIQYEIYEPFNKTKLDLSICKNVSIDIYIPIELSEKTQRLYALLFCRFSCRNILPLNQYNH